MLASEGGRGKVAQLDGLRRMILIPTLARTAVADSSDGSCQKSTGNVSHCHRHCQCQCQCLMEPTRGIEQGP